MGPGGNDNPGPPGDVVDEVDTVVDDEGQGGGGSSGGGFGGGGSAGMSPEAAHRKALRGVLFGLNLPPALFSALIEEAVKGEWNSQEFMWALGRSDVLHGMMPGIGNLINRRGMTPSQAISFWRAQANAYKEEARRLNLGRLARLTPERVGWLIRNNVDVEEFGFRLGMLQSAKSSENVREDVNRLLKSYGEQQLDKLGWYRTLMGMGDKRFYNLYEGVRLMGELGPEGLTAKMARQLSRVAGGAGQPADLNEVSSTIEHLRRQLGTQQLADAGLKINDLALAALRDQLNSRPAQKRADTILTQLDQLLRNREASQRPLLNPATLQEQGRPVDVAAPSGEYAGM